MAVGESCAVLQEGGHAQGCGGLDQAGGLRSSRMSAMIDASWTRTASSASRRRSCRTSGMGNAGDLDVRGPVFRMWPAPVAMAPPPRALRTVSISAACSAISRPMVAASSRVWMSGLSSTRRTPRCPTHTTDEDHQLRSAAEERRRGRRVAQMAGWRAYDGSWTFERRGADVCRSCCSAVWWPGAGRGHRRRPSCRADRPTGHRRRMALQALQGAQR